MKVGKQVYRLWRAVPQTKQLSFLGLEVMEGETSLYRCIITTPGGFIQQLAVSLLPNGFRYYVTGTVPLRKTPEEVDHKLLTKYGVGLGRTSRARLRARGEGVIHYLRYRQSFVLIATGGPHLFHEEEAGQVRDITADPLLFHGHQIGFVDGRSQVRIHEREYQQLRGLFLAQAAHLPAEQLVTGLRRLSYEHYGPVCSQLARLVRDINSRRKKAHIPLLGHNCLRLGRYPYSVFENPSERLLGRLKGQLSLSELRNFLLPARTSRPQGVKSRRVREAEPLVLDNPSRP